MWPIPSGTRIFLYRPATNLQLSFDRLAALVRAELGENPLSGALFVFRNRRGDRVKILYWDSDGFALWYKRLEKGTFRFPQGESPSIDGVELAMLLAGVTPLKRQPRFQLGNLRNVS